MQELFNKIYEQTGVSRNKLAADLGVSRAMINNIASGKRGISKEIFASMAKVDYLTPYKEELTEAYFRHIAGEANYDMIKYFMEEAKSFSYDADNVDLTQSIDFSNISNTLNKEEIISVACSFLSEAIKKNEPLYSNYPFSFSELDDALYSVAKQSSLYSSDIIFHTVSLPRNIEKSSIDAYWKSFRWGSMKIITYASFDSIPSNPLPWYVISGSKIIMFSDNIGHIIESEEIAQLYLLSHNNLKSYPIISIIHDEVSCLTGNNSLSSKTLRSMNSFICPHGVTDYDMLKRTMPEYIPEDVKHRLTTAYLKYYNVAERYTDYRFYTPEEAIIDRIETGREYTVSKKYLNNYSDEDVKIQLARLAEIEAMTMIRKGKLQLPKGISIDVYDEAVVTHFVYTNEDARDYEMLSVIPISMIIGLNDFFSSIFSYLDFDINCYSEELKKRKLSQLAELRKLALQ